MVSWGLVALTKVFYGVLVLGPFIVLSVMFVCHAVFSAGGIGNLLSSFANNGFTLYSLLHGLVDLQG